MSVSAPAGTRPPGYASAPWLFSPAQLSRGAQLESFTMKTEHLLSPLVGLVVGVGGCDMGVFPGEGSACASAGGNTAPTDAQANRA